ncbi:MAG: hypothetical protein PVI03_02025 [Candidatus Thorarchaeota archaeon]|jgi:hypothetical protein
MLDIIKVVSISHCEICPFGVIKGIQTDNPKLYCQRSNKFICNKPVATEPPDWCELVDLEELVLKNRHEVIKIIERAYGPLHINPWEQLKEVGKIDWKKTYLRKYYQMDSSPKAKKRGT